MYDAWILALQKGIGAALQRVNTDSIEMDDKSLSNRISSNGNLKNDYESSGKDKKLKKVRLVI